MSKMCGSVNRCHIVCFKYAILVDVDIKYAIVKTIILS